MEDVGMDTSHSEWGRVDVFVTMVMTALVPFHVVNFFTYLVSVSQEYH
jgi:hypothetical protein